MRKSEENINNLILLLKMTSQERDEARDQLQILLNKMAQASPVNACFQAETQQMVQIRGNSSVTDSDTLSETPKHQQQQQQQHQCRERSEKKMEEKSSDLFLTARRRRWRRRRRNPRPQDTYKSAQQSPFLWRCSARTSQRTVAQPSQR